MNRPFVAMHSLREDLQFGMRQFHRAPGYVLFTVLVLALGIGTVTAMFTISYGVLLKPLPFRADRQLFEALEQSAKGDDDFGASYAEITDWQQATKDSADVAFASGGVTILDTPTGAELVSEVATSPNLFPVLGVQPMMGRAFSASEQVSDHSDVVVLGYAMWQRSFGGDHNVLGKVVHIGGVQHSIIGVMPKGFEYPVYQDRGEVWVPLERRTLTPAPNDPYGPPFTAILYVISALGSALAWSWPSLMVYRFIGGLGIGASSVLGPVYIAELSPAKWRGRLVGTFQFNVVFGILAAYTSNYVIRLLHLGTAEWRWQVGIAAAPAFGFLILLFSIPRSPRWSASKNRIDEALEVLRLMGEPNPEGELAEIRTALDQEHTTAHEPVFRWKYRYPLFLAITIGAFNQLAGINAILYYLNNIFAAAGFSQISGDQQAIAIGFTNLIFTMVGMSVIDKLGRKTLLLIGAAGTAACLAGVALIFTSNSHQPALVWLLIAYISFFALSQGAVIWVYIGEVFPNHVRSKGQGVGNASHWIMNTCIALVFPTVAATMGRGAPFVFFSAMTLLQFLVVLIAYPETKGQTLEQLQLRLVKA